METERPSASYVVDVSAPKVLPRRTEATDFSQDAPAHGANTFSC